MSLASHLIGFALRQICDVGSDQFLHWVEERFTDHTQALPRAMTRANDRAWQVVGLALGGEGIFDRLKDLFRDADLKAIRDQVRRFLEATPTGIETTDPIVRSRCLEEWSSLRKAGRFALATVDRSSLRAVPSPCKSPPGPRTLPGWPVRPWPVPPKRSATTPRTWRGC